MHTILSPCWTRLAAAMLLAATVRPAAAQKAPASERARSEVRHAAVSADAVPRTVAEYVFTTSRRGGLPSLVTIADSAGELVASFRVVGERAVRPMMIVVLDTGLVLQGETPDGLLTLEFYGQNEGVGNFVGRWHLGQDSGPLRGRVAR